MNQWEAFGAGGEGDLWLERNRQKLGQRDPVSEAIERAGIVPEVALEIGCSTGWRLAKLRERYGCGVMGVEPSREACKIAADMGFRAWSSTAATIPIRSQSCDLLIYGFCLYVTDPSDWFRIAMEGDRVLQDGGHLVIHDFDYIGYDFARRYEHREGIFSYHIDWSRFWLAHPWYHRVLVTNDGVHDERITILQKQMTIEVVE